MTFKDSFTLITYSTICVLLTQRVIVVRAGISYQSVSFVHNHFKPITPGPSLLNRPDHFPLRLNYFESIPDDIWPSSLFDLPEDFLDITLEHPEPGHSEHHHHGHGHDFINELDLPVDPYLLTGYRAKQAVNYLYGRGELFYTDIPHARAILKLQRKRVENGLRPNRLGSLNPRSPFYTERQQRYSF